VNGIENFRLKVFRAVAERLNFTQAADALHLTQPAVTLQIKTLESNLEVRLFHRTGVHVSLTDAGEVLLQYVRQIDDLTSKVQMELGQLTGEEGGRLALGASTTIGQYTLPPLIGKFLAAHPRVESFLYGANTEEVVNALTQKPLDLALIEGPSHRADLRTELFMEDEIVIIVHPDNEWVQSGSDVGAKELQHAPLILRERGSGTREVVESALRKAGLSARKLNIAMELDSSEAIKCAVEAGLGVGFVSRWALQKERQLGSLGIVRIPGVRIQRKLNFVYAQGPKPAGIAGSFLQFAREYGKLLKLQFPDAIPSNVHKTSSGRRSSREDSRAEHGS
jgi:LysR family transcriptional regulator, transcriptional activator of the cysJI operon